MGGTVKKVWGFITNSRLRFAYLCRCGFFNKVSDEKFLKMQYKNIMGKELNIDCPQTFNEKLQWLKLNDRNPIYKTLVDKYEVKNYISEKIGEKYIIPTLGVWDRFNDIEFDSLPNQFVLKCTHDSGGVSICKDKSDFDFEKARDKIESSLKRNYYYSSREWPYKNVTPKIIAEKYMEDRGESLQDYKFMCFNGEMKCSFVCSDRFSEQGLHVTFFDRDWNVMPFERHYPSKKEGLPKPKNYDKMIELAEILSKDIPFVRVDFYEIAGEIYFGELTFYPGSGYEEFTPEEWDYELGKWIDLKSVNKVQGENKKI